MAGFVYRKAKGRNLHKGDQLKSADGRTWLDPIRDVQADAARYGVVEVWIDRALSGSPDFELYGSGIYQVRRAR